MSVSDTRCVSDLYDLSGKVALVTGATGQLGRPMSEALSEMGAKVVINSRSEKECKSFADKLGTKHEDAMAASGDVTVESDVKEIMEEIKAEFGGLDILVNNAYSGVTEHFEDMSVSQFKTGIDGALTSAFLCTREAIPLLKDNGGSIINVASIYGIVAPDHSIYGDTGLNNPVNYGTAKAGVIQLSRWVATKYSNKEVRANAISFGGFYNDDLEDLPDYSDVFVPNYEDRTPLNRMGDPEDVKGPVTFLASDASQWMTGQNLVIDGGWTAW